MTLCIRCVLALLLIAWAGTLVQSQSPAKVVRKGSISGKVTVKGKARAGVPVSARLENMTGPFPAIFKAVTDPQGIYKIIDLQPGNYYVATMTPGLVTTGETSPYQAVVLSEDESAEGIDFSLTVGGVITGKITDADGRPVIEQRVFLLPADPPKRRNATAASMATTDDRGIYRMFGLPAGRYKVSMGQGQESYLSPPSYWKPVYKQTFHPTSQILQKATVVEVAAAVKLRT